jgi:hypothetical protein
MAAARFCSECGERLKVKRRAVLPLRAFCARCSPRFRTVRLVSAATLVLATIGFTVSRLSPEREPFYFIGTPLQLSTNGGTSGSQNSIESASSGSQTAKAVDTVVSVCGAPTRSGKPCQRKVKGGGYCWQHRAKAGVKQASQH